MTANMENSMKTGASSEIPNEIMTIGGVDCYEKDSVAYLRLETCARGLGFTQTQNKDGTEYTSIRWERVERYLGEFGFPHKWGKDDFIPENVFYRLAMKAKNETAERFQSLVADEIIPSVRKTGAYIAGRTKMADISPLLREIREQNDRILRALEKLDSQSALDTSSEYLEAWMGNPFLSGSASMAEDKLRELNRKMRRICDAYELDWNKALHRFYETMERRLGVSLNSFRDVYRFETGKDDACIMNVLAVHPELNAEAHRVMDKIMSLRNSR